MSWKPIDGSLKEIVANHALPMAGVLEGRIPAVVVRQAFPGEAASTMVDDLFSKGLLYDPRKSGNRRARRIDVGCALGLMKHDAEGYFAAARKSRQTFETLFAGRPNPVEAFYSTLSALFPDRPVETAKELDGRSYGAAVIRSYFEGLGHRPHFDSAAMPNTAFRYRVASCGQQLAAVMCLQNSRSAGRSQPIIYAADGHSPMAEHLGTSRFEDECRRQGIERAAIHLEPGDMYLFRSLSIHEVPAVDGDRPRVSLAAFLGYSAGDEPVHVWS